MYVAASHAHKQKIAKLQLFCDYSSVISSSCYNGQAIFINLGYFLMILKLLTATANSSNSSRSMAVIFTSGNGLIPFGVLC